MKTLILSHLLSSFAIFVKKLLRNPVPQRCELFFDYFIVYLTESSSIGRFNGYYGGTGFRPNERIAAALVMEGNLGLRISDIVNCDRRTHRADIDVFIYC